MKTQGILLALFLAIFTLYCSASKAAASPPTLPVLRISGINQTQYSSLQSAYDAASNTDNILIKALDLNENLSLNRDVSITVTGGYNSDFTAVTGLTTNSGTLTISAGTVIIKNLIVTGTGGTDTAPDQFTFTDQTGAALSTLVTSNMITVSGINAASPISITGGTYSVNSGAYTSAAGSVTDGATVTVRVTSSASYSTTVNSTLTIGGVSDTFSVTTITDTLPPTVPQPLTAVAATCNQSNLSWPASTDSGGSGLKGYNIYRNGSYIKQVIAPATTTTDPGLTASTNYTYTALAVDNANNQSALSNAAVTVTPACPDTIAPTVPTGLTATVVSASQINLTWNASTDTGGSGLAGYKIYDGISQAQLGTSTTTSYSESSLNANTQYCFTAAAYDNAGNTSGKSTQMCATTQASSQQPGEHIWSKRYGGSSSDYGRTLKVDSNGNVIVAGRFMGSTADFGGGPLTNIGSMSLFVAKYDAQGSHLWSKAFGGTSSSVLVQSIALDSNDDVMVIGYFSGAVDLGGGVLTSAGLSDIFIAKYSGTSGAHQWSRRFGSINDDYGYGIAADSSGNIVVTGSFKGQVDFGGVTLQGYYTSLETFVAKYSATGTLLWAKNFLNTGDDVGYSIATDANNNIFMTGYFSGRIDFGGGLLTSAGAYDIFVTNLSSAGTHKWSKTFGGTSNDCGYGIAVDGSGNVTVTGIFDDTVNFGGGALYGWQDIFVAKYSGSNGTHMWSRSFGGSSSSDVVNGIAVDSSGDVLLTGYFSYTADFGGGPVTSMSNSQDIFVVKYSGTNGAYVWARSFGSTSNEVGYGIATDSYDDSVVTTGYFLGALNFGGGTLTSAGSLDVYLIKLAP